MKRLLIGDNREPLLASLETILKHWGYRVTASSRPQQLVAFLKEISPDLLIMGTPLLSAPDPGLREAVARKIATAPCPLIILGDPGSAVPKALSCEILDVPLDIFALFEMIQKYLEKYPRKNLRLTVKLPGMYSRGESSLLAEVLSLSSKGLFIRTGNHLERGDQLNVVIPLLGMKKELEITGKVLYRTDPAPENNYLQGVGLEFSELSEETRETLTAFIEQHLLGELANRDPSLEDQFQKPADTEPE